MAAPGFARQGHLSPGLAIPSTGDVEVSRDACSRHESDATRGGDPLAAMMRRQLGRASLSAYQGSVRLRDKLFTLLVAGAFGTVGRRSVIQLPARLAGVRGIHLGDGVFIGAGSWLQTLGDSGMTAEGPRVSIGSRCSFAGACTVSAASSIELGEAVLLARGVYISDHSHAYRDRTRPVIEQGIDEVASVRIGDGAWLGQNVVVTPGVTIGAGAVVGANSVVLSDVPDFSVAVGAPARVVGRSDAPARPDVS